MEARHRRRRTFRRRNLHQVRRDDCELPVTSLREVIETYHRSLRWDSATQQHRDPFIQWYRDVVSANPGIDVRLRILLILVNARFDQGTVAERAMENTRRIFESGLPNRDAVSLEELPPLNTPARKCGSLAEALSSFVTEA